MYTIKTYNFLVVIILGLQTKSLQLRLESKQLRILCGVCVSFAICHSFRIFRNGVHLYYTIGGIKVSECNYGCASPYPLWSHVSLVVICNCQI